MLNYLTLQLGKENASALMIAFGFLYINTIPLANVMERAELFEVSQEMREQLCLALSDLVTLVASVAARFQEAIREAQSQSVSINLYSTFSTQIKSFHERCEEIAQSMWRHQVLADDMDPGAGTEAPITPVVLWRRSRATRVRIGLFSNRGIC